MWGCGSIPSPRMRASSLSVARIVIDFSLMPGVKCRVFQQPARGVSFPCHKKLVRLRSHTREPTLRCHPRCAMISRRTVIVSLFVALLALALPHPALAAPIIVGNGTPASCTEAAARFALAVAETSGGGTIRFKCGPLATTIVFNESDGGAVLVLPGDTVINGGGLITFAGNPPGFFVPVPADTNAVLKNLIIASRSGFPSILNHGTLSVENSTVSGTRGGGIWNFGTLDVHRSTFSENGGFFSSAIRNGGSSASRTVSSSTMTAVTPVPF
jgi:hypothetical protein